MRKIILWAAAAWTMLAGAVNADQNPVVVELFTSQGCSSCPPADAILEQLAGREDVIPLALHVDYWDYIGWKDSFASPQYTKRQKGYAQAGGWRTIYTPQMVINGADDVVGSRPMKVSELIQKHAARAQKVDLEVARQGGQLQIRAEALAGTVQPSVIHLVRYAPSKEVRITRGENAGRSLTYTHVVQKWETAGSWDGRGDFELSVAVNGSDPVVVLVQEANHGSIIAAARLR